MNKLIRINHKGYVETIYKNTDPKLVTSYLDLVIKKNTLFKSYREVTFFDGCQGVESLNENGNKTLYKLILE